MNSFKNVNIFLFKALVYNYSETLTLALSFSLVCFYVLYLYLFYSLSPNKLSYIYDIICLLIERIIYSLTSDSLNVITRVRGQVHQYMNIPHSHVSTDFLLFVL